MSEPEHNGAARTTRVGRHLPTSGGLVKNTLRLAREQGLEAVQIFVSNPQGWAVPQPRPDAEEFVEGAREAGLSPVVVHAKYLINLASPDPDHRRRSAEVLAAELVVAGAVGARYVVVHSGSHGATGRRRDGAPGRGARPGAGDRGRRVGGAPPGGARRRELGGAGTQLCATFEDLARVTAEAGVKACVDTAHAFVAGHDLSTPEGARRVAGELREALGAGSPSCTSTTRRTSSGAGGTGTRG
ncbi:TIM barrel protein [Rubrobacter marinus]|nr:TIM barrel protein [Rubrobacter marinus]